MTDAERPDFGGWLLAQSDRSDRVGDLARKYADDPDWPRYGDYRAVDKYVHPQRYGSGTTAIAEALDLYEAEFPA
jgi:hypothetical protein